MRRELRILSIATWLVVAIGVLGIAVCSSESSTTESSTTTASTEPVAETPVPQADAVAPAEQYQATDVVAAMAPQFGGVVQALGQYVVELLARQDGLLEAQIRDPQGQAVPMDNLSVAAEIEPEEADGDPIPVVMLPSEDRYIGAVAGVTGQRIVKLALNQAEQLEPIAEATFEAINIASTAVPVQPQHNGRVSLLGDAKIEVATDSNGRIYVSITDHDGTPLPPDVVNLSQLQFIGPTGPQVVRLTPRGAMYVGNLGGAPPPMYSVVFDIGFGSRNYRRIRLRRLRPVPATVTVQVPPRFTKAKTWRRDWQWGWTVRPTPLRPVRVRPGVPPPPGVRVRPGVPPPPSVRVSPGAPPPPSVRVTPGAPPPPPSVKVRVNPPPPPPSVKVRPGAPPPPPSVKVRVNPPPPVKGPPPPQPPSVKVRVKAPPPPQPAAPPRPAGPKAKVRVKAAPPPPPGKKRR